MLFAYSDPRMGPFRKDATIRDPFRFFFACQPAKHARLAARIRSNVMLGNTQDLDLDLGRPALQHAEISRGPAG